MPSEEPCGAKRTPPLRYGWSRRELLHSDSEALCLLHSERNSWHSRPTSITGSRESCPNPDDLSTLLPWQRLFLSCCLQHNGFGRNHCVPNLWALSQYFFWCESTYGTHEKSWVGSCRSCILIFSTVDLFRGANSCKHWIATRLCLYSPKAVALQ